MGESLPLPAAPQPWCCLCRCCLCCRLSLSSIVSLWLPLSAPAQLSAPACVPASERVSEGAALLRHAVQPQPLCSACAPEPTPCLIIQDMSTAFHRRHGQQEPGQGRGQPPAQDRDPRSLPETLSGCPPNSCSIYPSHSWGPQMVPLPSHTGMSAAPRVLGSFCHFWTTPQEGSANSIVQLLASPIPDSSTQPPPDPTTPLTVASRNSLGEPLV